MLLKLAFKSLDAIRTQAKWSILVEPFLLWFNHAETRSFSYVIEISHTSFDCLRRTLVRVLLLTTFHCCAIFLVVSSNLDCTLDFDCTLERNADLLEIHILVDINTAVEPTRYNIVCKKLQYFTS